MTQSTTTSVVSTRPPREMMRTVRGSVPVDKFKTLKGENRLLVIGIPILVIVAVVGWGIWRATATLDDIEARTLDPSSVLSLTWEHLVIVVISAVIVLVTAIPLGIVLTRPATAFLSPIVTAIANIGQAAPVIGVIVLLAIWLGFGAPVAIAALWFYAFLPVLANVVAGLRGVDKDLVEAARGLSMSPMQVLFKVELPLALPVIMNGVRTALVLLVGAGAFATFIDAGGLGGLITAGINLYRNPILMSGGVLIAALALAIEWVGRVLEIGLTPKGMLKSEERRVGKEWRARKPAGEMKKKETNDAGTASRTPTAGNTAAQTRAAADRDSARKMCA